MRVFVACQQSASDYQVPAYRFWRYHFFGGLSEAGHEPLEAHDADWAEGLALGFSGERETWLERTWTRTLEAIRREMRAGGVDLFIGYLFPHQVLGDAVRQIRDLGVPTVNFFCDNVREYRAVPAEFRSFDLNWVPEFKALALYRRAGIPFIHLPMPCWVPPGERRLSFSESGRVAFIGSGDPLRDRLLSEVAALGVPLDVSGAGWNPDEVQARGPAATVSVARRAAHWGAFVRRQGLMAALRRAGSRSRGPAVGDLLRRGGVVPQGVVSNFGEALRSASVCLGVNRYQSFRHPDDRPDTYSRLRDIEAPMYGACLLTEWTEGIDLLYEEGEEVETYRNAAELAEKAGSLLRDPARRESLRRRGQAKALSSHSVGRSVSAIVSVLG